MAREFFCCYYDYLEKLARLSDAEVGRLIRALLLYGATGEVMELKGQESFAFDFIKVDIDSANKSYEEKCKKLSANAASRYNCMQLQQKQQMDAKADNRIEENRIEKKESVKKNAIAFSPPTLDEVKAFAEEIGHPEFDADYFMNHYNGNGWMAGRVKMKDWKATVRNWISRDAKENPAPKKPVTRETYNDAWKYGG